MPTDRKERNERATMLGRIGYRLARRSKIEGVITIESEDKVLREFERGALFIDLCEPHRNMFETDFSRLRVSYGGLKVLELRWDRAGRFRVICSSQRKIGRKRFARRCEPVRLFVGVISCTMRRETVWGACCK